MYVPPLKAHIECPLHPAEKVNFVCVDRACGKYMAPCCRLCRFNAHGGHSRKVIFLDELRAALKCQVIEKGNQLPPASRLQRPSLARARLYSKFIR
jgi:hypothetical protein